METFNSIYYTSTTKEMTNCTKSEYLRYLKGKFTNLERFISRFVDVKLEKLGSIKESHTADYNAFKDFFKFLVDNYEEATTFTTKEAFELENREFQALVFSSINIPSMIKELGAERHKVEGVETKHRRYDTNGNYIGDETYHNIYETHKVNGKKLGVTDDLYILKCWCTSTNKEHFLWVDAKYKDDPLSAIASTFMVHENIIPHIKCLKRQGDILMVEMKQEVKPEGNVVSLTKEQYFDLLVTQS
jgi:hypothetical protein